MGGTEAKDTACTKIGEQCATCLKQTDDKNIDKEGTVDAAGKCSEPKCKTGFSFSKTDKKCMANKCTCELGTEAKDVACTKIGEQCATCLKQTDDKNIDK